MRIRASGREVQFAYRGPRPSGVVRSGGSDAREPENRLGEQGRIRRDRMKADRSLAEMGLLRLPSRGGLEFRRAVPPPIRRRFDRARWLPLRDCPCPPSRLSVTRRSGGGRGDRGGRARVRGHGITRRLGDPSAAASSDRCPCATRSGGGLPPRPPVFFGPAGQPCGPAPPIPGSKVLLQGRDLAEPVASPAPGDPSGPARSKAPELQAPRCPRHRLSRPRVRPSTWWPSCSRAARVASPSRLGDEVRVVSVGDRIEGWTCLSIDRDEGALFSRLPAQQIALRAAQGQHVDREVARRVAFVNDGGSGDPTSGGRKPGARGP